MITFNYEVDFELPNEEALASWIEESIKQEESLLGEINYIFCNDEDLLKINVKYLNHDTYTDIISFDYSLNETISGDIYISLERVEENAEKFNVTFENELHRVMIHGILHYLGYKDKTEQDKNEMRSKENELILLLNN